MSALRSRGHAPSRHGLVLLGIAAMSVPSACAQRMIPNTDVPDVRENREVIDVAERYRRAVEQRDTRTLLELAAQDYFEDAGTPDGDDDYGYEGLRRLLGVWSSEVREVRYETRYRRVSFESDGDRAFVDFTFTGSFTLRAPGPGLAAGGRRFPGRRETMFDTDPARAHGAEAGDGERWFRRVGDNRLELVRVDGRWRIHAGM